MNDETRDTVKAMALALVVFGVTTLLWIVFIQPLELEQLDQVKQNCLLPECTYTIDPSWLNLVIIVSPSILTYVLLVTHFDGKRSKKWQNLT